MLHTYNNHSVSHTSLSPARSPEKQHLTHNRLATAHFEARSTKVGDMGHPNTKLEDKEELAKETKRQEAVK